ncbi:MAG: hypothetical protein WCC14_21400, partial [Acidobacteriaceae bacterium]
KRPDSRNFQTPLTPVDEEAANLANEVITGFSGSRPTDNSKPANEVITGLLPEVTSQEQGGKRSSGASEPYREMIELELSRGRNAMGIWQDLVAGVFGYWPFDQVRGCGPSCTRNRLYSSGIAATLSSTRSPS